MGSWKAKFEEFIKAEQVIETADRIVYQKAFLLKPLAFWKEAFHFHAVVVEKESHVVHFINEHVLNIDFPEEKSKKDETSSEENGN